MSDTPINAVEELQAEARAAIGTQAEDDYVLDPTKHAAEYAKSASRLAALLNSARLSIIAKRYKQRDQQAADAQSEYKRTMERANLAIFATAVLSGLMMAAQIVAVPWSLPPWSVGALGLLSALCGALATMWLYQVRQGKLLERWMTARANAETARISYFTALAEPGDAVSDAALNLLKLEYFCRYQYDVQTNYYRNRGRKHDRAARRNLESRERSRAPFRRCRGHSWRRRGRRRRRAGDGFRSARRHRRCLGILCDRT